MEYYGHGRIDSMQERHLGGSGLSATCSGYKRARHIEKNERRYQGEGQSVKQSVGSTQQSGIGDVHPIGIVGGACGVFTTDGG